MDFQLLLEVFEVSYISDFYWDRVPYFRIYRCEVAGGVVGCLVLEYWCGLGMKLCLFREYRVGYSWICAMDIYLWLCSGRFSWVCGCWNGCISEHTLRVYRFIMLSICSSVMSAFVCVLGGTFFISLMIFFCVLMSGWM